MKKISTIGVDLAKNVFQLHGCDEGGQVVQRRQLRRKHMLKYFASQPPCLVGMEACGSAHHWAREIAALGHEVRLMPPSRVKPYVKRGHKNDQADAAACREAVTRPSMQFVPVKTVEQQAALMTHRARQVVVEQRTQLSNAIRAHLAEFGIVAAKGPAGFAALLGKLANDDDPEVPAVIRPILAILVEQWRSADQQVDKLDAQILAWHRNDPDSQRVATIPQIGAIIASALVATVGDATRFKNGRQLAAWLGLVPSQHSTGGKVSLGGITKAGDRYLRKLLVVGATGMLRRVKADPAASPWMAKLLATKEPKLAAVALANKMARMAWAILVNKDVYRAPTPTVVPQAA